MLASVNDAIITGVSGRNYNVIEFIASGGFGSVFRVQYGKKEYICKTEHATDYSSLIYESWVIRYLTQRAPTGMFLNIIDFELNSKQTGIIMEMGGVSLSRYIEQKGTFQSLGTEGIIVYLQLLS
jgi:hypothetical protein